MVTAAVLGHFLRIGKLPKIPYSASPHAALQAARALLLEEVGGASIGARIYLYPYLLVYLYTSLYGFLLVLQLIFSLSTESVAMVGWGRLRLRRRRPLPSQRSSQTLLGRRGRRMRSEGVGGRRRAESD